MRFARLRAAVGTDSFLLHDRDVGYLEPLMHMHDDLLDLLIQDPDRVDGPHVVGVLGVAHDQVGDHLVAHLGGRGPEGLPQGLEQPAGPALVQAGEQLVILEGDLVLLAALALGRQVLPVVGTAAAGDEQQVFIAGLGNRALGQVGLDRRHGLIPDPDAAVSARLGPAVLTPAALAQALHLGQGELTDVLVVVPGVEGQEDHRPHGQASAAGAVVAPQLAAAVHLVGDPLALHLLADLGRLEQLQAVAHALLPAGPAELPAAGRDELFPIGRKPAVQAHVAAGPLEGHPDHDHHLVAAVDAQGAAHVVGVVIEHLALQASEGHVAQPVAPGAQAIGRGWIAPAVEVAEGYQDLFVLGERGRLEPAAFDPRLHAVQVQVEQLADGGLDRVIGGRPAHLLPELLEALGVDAIGGFPGGRLPHAADELGRAAHADHPAGQLFLAGGFVRAEGCGQAVLWRFQGHGAGPRVGCILLCASVMRCLTGSVVPGKTSASTRNGFCIANPLFAGSNPAAAFHSNSHLMQDLRRHSPGESCVATGSDHLFKPLFPGQKRCFRYAQRYAHRNTLLRPTFTTANARPRGRVRRGHLRACAARRARRGREHGGTMLVLSRARQESIMVGHDIEITVEEIRGDRVRLGITAPKEIQVHRREVYEEIRRQAAQDPAPTIRVGPGRGAIGKAVR